MMTPIETYYNGHQFRSRLEARWAALFDLLDWTWTYEPIDANGYIPDFLIGGYNSFIAEVRPSTRPADYLDEAKKVAIGLEGVWGGNTIILGANACLTETEDVRGREAWPCQDKYAGYYLPDGPMAGGCQGDRYNEGLVQWTTCEECGNAAVRHTTQSFKCMPCGHYEGDAWAGPTPNIQLLWGEAHAKTRWTR